jgi:hypothetical protein
VEQLQSSALMFLTFNALAFNIYLVFFGFWCAVTGYLIYRSTFLPRILGVLLMIAGVGWATQLSPSFARQIFPLVATASALAEIPLMLWLLFKGVNAQRWKEQAGTTIGGQVR